MHRLLDSFKLGFTSDRIALVLSKIQKNVKPSEPERKVVDEGIELINQILQGREQIDTGQFGSNSLDSLKLYNKSLNVILDTPEPFGEEINFKQIKGVFCKLRNSLEKIEEGKASEEEIKNAKFFFESLRMATLDDSTTIVNGLNESRSQEKWAYALEI
jgi:hypothetical protein